MKKEKEISRLSFEEVLNNLNKLLKNIKENKLLYSEFEYGLNIIVMVQERLNQIEIKMKKYCKYKGDY